MSCCGIRTKSGVELAALTYGIIGCTISLAGALSFTGFMIYISMFLISQYPGDKDIISFVLFLLLMVVVFVTTFVFALYLIKGIKYRNPKYVLSYFIFGIVETVLLVLACVGYIYWNQFITDDYQIIDPAIAIGVIVVYALPLPVVWIAYRSVEGNPDYQECARA